MTALKCPGQDTRFWTPDDIFEIPCPHCGEAMEFFKTDMRLPCPACGRHVANPRRDKGCAAWCAHAVACMGGPGDGDC
ncbi:MAG: hypothetical protein AB7E47_06970 [Desulfovibrionaceae bacterium]